MKLIWNWIFVYGFALLGAVGVFYEFSPKIAVSSYQTLDPEDAFSAPFIVSNDGYLPIQLANVSCIVNDIFFERIRFRNFEVATDIDLADSIAPAERWTVKCRFLNLFEDKPPPPKTLQSADIQISINFQPYGLPFKRNKQFRFQSVKAHDGTWHWLPQPITNNPVIPRPKKSK